MEDATPLHLPQELIDKIIDNLHDSPRALKTCSLVSRSFHSRSHSILFHHVEGSMEAAHPFVTHLSPETLALIRSLTLSQPEYSTRVQSPQIPLILQSLNLNHLVLKRIDLRPLKTVFSSLRLSHLETQYCTSDSFSELRSMLWSIPSLTTLIVFFPMAGEPFDEDDDLPSHKSILSTLNTTDSAVLSPAYLTNLKELRRLNISLSTGDDVQKFSDIIAALHSSLRHLSIEISGDPAEGAVFSTPESVVLGSLQTFTFKFYHEDTSLLTQLVLEWGMNLLKMNAPNLAESLQTVTFRHCLYGVTATNVVLANVQVWNLLDALADLFPRMKEVLIAFVFIVGGGMSMNSVTAGLLADLSSVDNMIDTVRKALPKLAKRGVLVVDACEFDSWEMEACA